MERINWLDSYSVGVEAIDNQHRNLIELINKLIDANARKEQSSVIFDVLNELLDYTRVHFTSEEDFMAARGFPKLAEHKLEHYELMKRALELSASFWKLSETLPDDVLGFLKDWLTSHILAEDQKYARFLTQPRTKRRKARKTLAKPAKKAQRKARSRRRAR